MQMKEAARLVRARADAASGHARTVRLAAGLTQAEVASTVGVERATVALWEQGRRVPRGRPALKYAELLERLEAVASNVAP